MYQPEIKHNFVRNYCPPKEGWCVFVDIDPSEEGRTGDKRKSNEAKKRQKEMKAAGEKALKDLQKLGAHICRKKCGIWLLEKSFLQFRNGDNDILPFLRRRDILAFHPEDKICLIAEVEGVSSKQPEQRIYNAVGQLVQAFSIKSIAGWKRKKPILFLVVGEELAGNLTKMKTGLKKLNITGIVIGKNKKNNKVLFGTGMRLLDNGHYKRQY
jgi:hypothetical protein